MHGNGAGDEPAGRERARRQGTGRARNALTAFLTILLAIGIAILAYPTVADLWNRMHQSYAVAAYVERTEDMSAAEKERLIDRAREYNAEIAADPDRWHLSDAELDEYRRTLDITGTGIMGYVTIPRIKVRLPIYHGTDDTVLQIAAGHLAGSSLPVGGRGTHAAVSGHTGLPSARLLTGLDELEKGDTFAFHVLDETYTYRVDRISVVLPDRLDELDIDPDADYATLITCTPYGINTHRLLVRGHRIPNPTTPDDTGYDDPRMMTATLAGIAVAAAVALAGTAMLLASRGRRAAPAARHASDTAPRKEDDHTDRTGHPAPARPRPRHPE